MTVHQEDALYDFLDAALKPFTSAEVADILRHGGGGSSRRLQEEIDHFLRSRRLAFPFDDGERWLSRRGFFSDAVFTIKPTRLELRNGILIPGHRCLPFANPVLLPNELSFIWKGKDIPFTSSEGPPEEYYSYYDLYGEEYSPQYVAKENPSNEEAYNADPYEDPPEVSIKVLDMRAAFRECSFIPGDRFEVRTLDWVSGRFELRHAPASQWSDSELAEWVSAAETGFLRCFDRLGPAASTEEQIAFAYWYGDQRMKRTPAHSLEDFLYETSERIEPAAFGMETRFWLSGKEIPDSGPWAGDQDPPDKTETERILSQLGIPVSEYVVEAYVRDALFHGKTDVHEILSRLLPESVHVNRSERLFIAQFVSETKDEFIETYNIFVDKDMGPLRQRAVELHTAVVDLTLRLSAEDLNSTWLPKQAFVTLAQLQAHTAAILEDLDFDEAPEPIELLSIDNSLDAMVDTFGEIKEAIDDARESFRRSRISLIRADPKTSDSWRIIQVTLSGTKVWRRITIPENLSLIDLSLWINSLFSWDENHDKAFIIDSLVYSVKKNNQIIKIGELTERGIREILYDYSAEWEVKINLLHSEAQEAYDSPRCLGGEGAPPPVAIGGPLRFRRYLSALSGPEGPERKLALSKLGESFIPNFFDTAQVDRNLALLYNANAANRGEKDAGTKR